MFDRETNSRPKPGRRPLSRRFIAQHQRARIVAAFAEETSERGYRAVTVAGIVRRAGMSRSTFYENFASKEECLLAAQRLAMSEALKRVVDAAGELNSWALRVEAGLKAFLRYVAEEPELARTCMVEALAAGPDAAACHEQSRQAFISLFRLGRDVSSEAGELPETLEEAIVGGVFWTVHQRLVAGRGGSVESLSPEIVEFALTPYLGAERARRVARGEEGAGETRRRRAANKKLAS